MTYEGYGNSAEIKLPTIKTLDLLLEELRGIEVILNQGFRDKVANNRDVLKVNDIFARTAWETKIADGSGVSCLSFSEQEDCSLITTHAYHRSPFKPNFGKDLSKLPREVFLKQINKKTFPFLKNDFLINLTSTRLENILFDLINFQVWSNGTPMEFISLFNEKNFQSEIIEYLCGPDLCRDQYILNHEHKIIPAYNFLYYGTQKWILMKKHELENQTEIQVYHHDQVTFDFEQLNKNILLYQDVCEEINEYSNDYIKQYKMEVLDEYEDTLVELSEKWDPEKIGSRADKVFVYRKIREEQSRMAFDPMFWINQDNQPHNNTKVLSCDQELDEINSEQCKHSETNTSKDNLVNTVIKDWQKAHAAVTSNPIMRHLLLKTENGKKLLGYKGYSLDLLSCIQKN